MLWMLLACGYSVDTFTDDFESAYCERSVGCDYWTSDECIAYFAEEAFFTCDHIDQHSAPRCLDAIESETCDNVLSMSGDMRNCGEAVICAD